MDAEDFMAASVLAFFGIWLSIYSEILLSSLFVIELFVIFLMIILSAGILYLIYTGRSSAWLLLGILFAAAAANSIIVYFELRMLLMLASSLAINLIGMAFCFSRAPGRDEKESEMPEEPPEPVIKLDESDLIDHIDYEAPAKNKKAESRNSKSGKPAGKGRKSGKPKSGKRK